MTLAQKRPGNGAAHLFDGVPIPSAPVRGYLRAFQLAAVVVLADGRVTCVRDLGRIVGTPVAVYWTTAPAALSIMQRCREAMTADIAAVAAELRTPITAHDVVIERAERSIERMNGLLEQAKRNGSLAAFNQAYSAARAQARASGKNIMPYPVALDRLKRELYNAAAGATISGSIIAAALGIDGKRT